MRYQQWDFENDVTVTDRKPLFLPEDKKASDYMGSAYAVDTERGIFYQASSNPGHFLCTYRLYHIGLDEECIVFDDIMVIASKMDYTCIVFADLKTNKIYLLDTRGVVYNSLCKVQ